MSRSGILILAAVLLAGVAGVLLFGGDLLRKTGVPLSGPIGPDSESKLMSEVNEAASGGGFAITFSQAQSASWHVAPHHKLERFSLEGSDTAFARLTSSVPLDPQTVDWQSQGISTVLTPAFNNLVNGQRVEIGIVARAARVMPAQHMYAVYATQQAGNSGWRELGLSGEFALYKFTYDVPRVDGDGYKNPPILVIRASNGKAIELLGAYVKRVPKT